MKKIANKSIPLFQLEQSHLALSADGLDLIALAAVEGGVEPAHLFEERDAIAPEFQFHFAAHPMGRYNFSGFEILLHSLLLFIRILALSVIAPQCHLSQSERPWQYGKLSGFAKGSPFEERLPPAGTDSPRAGEKCHHR